MSRRENIQTCHIVNSGPAQENFGSAKLRRGRQSENGSERNAYFEREDALLERIEALGDLPETVETLEQLRRRAARRRRRRALHTNREEQT